MAEDASHSPKVATIYVHRRSQKNQHRVLLFNLQIANYEESNQAILINYLHKQVSSSAHVLTIELIRQYQRITDFCSRSMARSLVPHLSSPKHELSSFLVVGNGKSLRYSGQ
jgi:hypothetical protein